MKKEPKPRVVHYNKRGEEIDPARYVISRAENPELYRYLEELKNESIYQGIIRGAKC